MWGVVFAGAVSGVGDEVLHDLLTGQVPGILYRSGDLYATAAAFGAFTGYGPQGFGAEVALVSGIVVTLLLRIGSRLLGLRLPIPRDPNGT